MKRKSYEAKSFAHENLNEGLKSLTFGSLRPLVSPAVAPRAASRAPAVFQRPYRSMWTIRNYSSSPPAKNEDSRIETRVDMCRVNVYSHRRRIQERLPDLKIDIDVRKQDNCVQHVTSTNAMLSQTLFLNLTRSLSLYQWGVYVMPAITQPLS